jgi:mannose-6-phosphate isomerase-like protein (cupin superfamily)
MQLQAGTGVGEHVRLEEEVLIVQQGSLDIICDGHEITLSKGDLFSIPVSSTRSFQNSNTEPADVWVVRRGDKPAPAQFAKH